MIRDIAIHVNGSGPDRNRVAYGIQLARTFDSHLTCFVENLLIQIPFAFDRVVAAALPDATFGEAEARASELVEATKRDLDGAGLRHSVERIDAFLGGMLDAMARRVRTRDLFVSTLPQGRAAEGQDLIEAVLFRSGRGCFLVPPETEPPQSYDRVLLAWKDTRESARAITEAIPFLERAKEVSVVIVEEHGATEQWGEEAGADIGRYLSRHNVKAEIRKISGWENVAEALTHEARQVQADLVVLGGYGHSRFQEWVLGGVTRDLLRSATVPLLMAH